VQTAPSAAPAAEGRPGSAPETPSACLRRLTADLAAAHALPAIEGPGACGAVDVVRLDAVIGADARRVTLAPPAVVRCALAETIVHWIREDVGPLAAQAGAPLASITTAASFECRGRNRVVGAQLSQHGLANALDIRAFQLADGKTLGLTDPAVPRELRTRLQQSACARFTTVLGPGSDGYHEDHIHLDLAERRGGYRLCHWAVRDPAEAAAIAAAAAAKAAAAKLPKFVPLLHHDGGALGAVAPPPSARRQTRAGRSASCRAGQECLRGSVHPPAPSPWRGAARRSGFPRAVFPW
jgi:extensin-like protein